jgi:release factor glutamine methyltransferase
MAAPALTPTTSIESVRRSLAAAFRGAGLDSPELDARVLVGHALGLDQAALAAAAGRELSDREARHIAVLRERRLAHESVAAIVGGKEFWGLPFRVSSATLVPRPDTETVVEAALDAIEAGGARARTLRIADLGTGTGCLLAALLSELPNASGIGVDISLEALTLARDNIRALGLAHRARMLCGNFAGALAGRFDLIVSNPPYIASHEFELLAPEVWREPRIALDGGIDGLAAYRAIAADAPRLLASGGALVLEVGVNQAAPVASLLARGGLAPQAPKFDLAGGPRAVVAYGQPMR